MSTDNEMATNGTLKFPLWRHSDPDSTRMAAFMQRINKKYSLNLQGYHELHAWSIGNIEDFWGEVWDFTGITAERSYDEVRLQHSRDRFSPSKCSC